MNNKNTGNDMNALIRFAALSRTAHKMLEPYQTDPKQAVSIWNNIPIKHLDQVREWLAPIGGLRVIYRGPRYNLRKTWTKKADAVRFSIYQK